MYYGFNIFFNENMLDIKDLVKLWKASDKNSEKAKKNSYNVEKIKKLW